MGEKWRRNIIRRMGSMSKWELRNNKLQLSQWTYTVHRHSNYDTNWNMWCFSECVIFIWQSSYHLAVLYVMWEKPKRYLLRLMNVFLSTLDYQTVPIVQHSEAANYYLINPVPSVVFIVFILYSSFVRFAVVFWCKNDQMNGPYRNFFVT